MVSTVVECNYGYRVVTEVRDLVLLLVGYKVLLGEIRRCQDMDLLALGQTILPGG